MTEPVAEYAQNLLDNNPTPFQRFFMNVLEQNGVVSGSWIPDLAIMTMWMNARAVDYGAVVWPVSKEGDGRMRMEIKFYNPEAHTLWLLQWT